MPWALTNVRDVIVLLNVLQTIQIQTTRTITRIPKATPSDVTSSHRLDNYCCRRICTHGNPYGDY